MRYKWHRLTVLSGALEQICTRYWHVLGPFIVPSLVFIWDMKGEGRGKELECFSTPK